MTYAPVIYGAPADRADEADAEPNAQSVRDSLERAGYDSDIIVVDLDLAALERIAQRKPAFVFNLVEAIRGDGRLAPLASAMLDHLKLAYTGAPLGAYLQSSSKLLCKNLLAAAGLPHPPLWSELNAGRPDAKRPEKLIVKSVWEHASFGLDQGSIVAPEDARAEIARREARFGGSFFAETYIEGREFNLSLLQTAEGARVLPMAEMAFDALPDTHARIVDYDAKWNQASVGFQTMQRRFGVEAREPTLAGRMQTLALELWRAAELRGYARVDMRISPEHEIFILEFNANPCLAPDAGFMAAAAEAELSFDAVIAAIVAAAHRSA